MVVNLVFSLAAEKAAELGERRKLELHPIPRR
jgi:hypothetical protein